MGARPFLGAQAAHVVPVGLFSKRAPAVQRAVSRAQNILTKHGIDLNNPVNGFWATAGHLGTHKDRYLVAMADRLKTADLRGGVYGVLSELQKLKLDALAGKFI